MSANSPLSSETSSPHGSFGPLNSPAEQDKASSCSDFNLNDVAGSPAAGPSEAGSPVENLSWFNADPPVPCDCSVAPLMGNSSGSSPLPEQSPTCGNLPLSPHNVSATVNSNLLPLLPNLQLPPSESAAACAAFATSTEPLATEVFVQPRPLWASSDAEPPTKGRITDVMDWCGITYGQLTALRQVYLENTDRQDDLGLSNAGRYKKHKLVKGTKGKDAIAEAYEYLEQLMADDLRKFFDRLSFKPGEKLEFASELKISPEASLNVNGELINKIVYRLDNRRLRLLLNDFKGKLSSVTYRKNKEENEESQASNNEQQNQLNCAETDDGPLTKKSRRVGPADATGAAPCEAVSMRINITGASLRILLEIQERNGLRSLDETVKLALDTFVSMTHAQ